VSLNDNATLVIGSGNYLLAPVGTALPTDLAAPLSPWVAVGHTSLSDIFGVTSDGGDATTLGTLQNKTLRTTYAPRTDSFNFTLQQFDADSLKLYFGSNMVDVAGDGTLLGVHQSPAVTVQAFCAIFIDGSNAFAFYAPKAEIFRGDDMSIPDAESLAGLPLGVKPVGYLTNQWPYALTPIQALIEATGATAGTPGSFTPSGASTPASLAAMTGITASPATAWTTGQYVLLGDASHAHWDGSAWVAGDAP
jgi:hypothetical protein